jgi:predicted glutamine amidotransferase
MCGLVGIAGNLELKDEAFMKRLLVLDYFRGTDSTGLAAVRLGRDIEVAKIASHPMNLFDTKRFTAALNGPKSVAFIGHNRAATVGKVNDISAHPYHYRDIVGAHNGTLTNVNWKALEKELGFETSTDSESIIASIDEFGIEETIELLEEGASSSTGAWALTWYDKDKDTLNFIRNKHRPLWFAFNKARTKIVWASEWEFIEAARSMTKDWDLYVNETGHGFFEAIPDQLYEFPVADLMKGLSDDAIMACKTKKLKGKEPVVSTYSHTYSSGAPFTAGRPSTVTTTTTTGSRTGAADGEKTSGTGSNEEPKVVEMFGTMANPLAGFISEERFLKLTAGGCSFCGAEITEDTEGVTIFDEDDVILCPDCAPKSRSGLLIYTPEHNIIKATKVKNK